MNRRVFITTTLASSSYAFSLKNNGIDKKDKRYIGDRKKRYAMLIDLRKCIGCQACTAACINENQVPHEQFRTFVTEYELSKSDEVFKAFLPELCNHCENPPCVSVCPTGATFKREDGIVLVDNEICWGCSYCVNACPYDKRFINKNTKVADKCTFCVHLIDNNELPACVQTCVGRARIFGDLNDSSSEISQILKDYPTSVLKQNFGTKPQVFYINLDNELNEINPNHKMFQDISKEFDLALEEEWRIK
ncbi:4Fe-4S dicluster domain-containing protein [Campylobacter sp. RM12640]|uniref:sulfate reduction electron transfer complex DsrMKJOP subunit DsrO n=1 Tax=unclassified Campylobacter TaxID=2593542 RepID=UPI003014DE92|nr:4Fe-4S dicluster domain-containing protein [Campylobacter sp. RM12640]MBZ7990034.1 4Fe-4S dicluster domain-containing protein [Campylobacter sp. RM12635]